MAHHSLHPSTNRINQNIYHTAPRKIIANDRINAPGSRSRTSYFGSEQTPSRPGGTPAKTLYAYDHQRRKGKNNTDKNTSQDLQGSSYSEGGEDLEWLGIILARQKKLDPKPGEDTNMLKPPKSILKRKRHLNTLRKSNTAQSRHASQHLSTWTEESREQFVNNLTQEQNTARDNKRPYFTKHSGIRDTDVLGLEIPDLFDYDFEENDEDDMPKSKRSSRRITLA